MSSRVLRYLIAAAVVAGVARFIVLRTRRPRAPPVVTELWVYPLKSCQGIRMSSVELTPQGVKYDREWCVGDSEMGTILTQRDQPRLSLVSCAIDETRQEMVINAPGMPPLLVSMNADFSREASMTPIQWTVPRHGRSQGLAAAAWFAKFLSVPSACLLRSETPCEPSSHTMHYPVTALTDRGHMQDFSTLHVISQESLLWLRKRLPAASKAGADVARWRPNVVVSGTPRAFDEDTWVKFVIGGVFMRTAKPCGRCSVPAVVPETGKSDPAYQPIVALREERTAFYPHQAERNMEGAATWPMFGTHLAKLSLNE